MAISHMYGLVHRIASAEIHHTRPIRFARERLCPSSGRSQWRKHKVAVSRPTISVFSSDRSAGLCARPLCSGAHLKQGCFGPGRLSGVNKLRPTAYGHFRGYGKRASESNPVQRSGGEVTSQMGSCFQASNVTETTTRFHFRLVQSSSRIVRVRLSG